MIKIKLSGIWNICLGVFFPDQFQMYPQILKMIYVSNPYEPKYQEQRFAKKS